MSTEPDRSLTRRHLLGAAGAAAAVSVAGQGQAAAAPPPPSPPLRRQRAERGGPRTESIPDTNPAYEYYTYGASAFFPKGLGSGRNIGGLGATVTFQDDLQAAVTLPVGTEVREMSVWVNNASGNGAYLDLGRFSDDVDSGTYTFGLTVDIPNGQLLVNPLTATGSRIIDASGLFFLNAYCAPGMHVKAVRLGVIPAALSYRVVTPGRVYDSRPAQSGAGPLATGLNRTISVADRINPVGGAVVQEDFVPEGARAVSLNITAVNTVGNGYFVVNPGGNTTVGASSVNWTAGRTIANGIVCSLDDSRQLTIVAGGSNTSANFIIDITGYYL